jgi:hypothetical protein
VITLNNGGLSDKNVKNISPAVKNAIDTDEKIANAVTNPQAKNKLNPLFTLSDVWRLLGGKTADSKESKRAQRDLANLMLMGKVYAFENRCPTCGSELHTDKYSLELPQERISPLLGFKTYSGGQNTPGG